MSAAAITIGCQLNSWQREFDLRRPTWENLDAALGQLATAGYTGVEVPHWCVPDLAQPERLRALTARHGLALSALHVGGNFFDADLYQAQTLPRGRLVAQCAAGAGATALVVSGASLRSRLGPGVSAEQSSPVVQTLLHNLAEFGRVLRDHGLALDYHNHQAQFADGAWEMERLLAVDATLLRFCVDVGHAAQALSPPGILDWLAHHWSRVGSLHYKDIRDGEVVEALGDGELDFAAISRQAQARQFTGWIVAELGPLPAEQTHRSALENARRSYRLIDQALTS